jgi:hypothetical protein
VAWQPETVYLGGGTPSGMAASDLDRILARGSRAASGKKRPSKWRQAQSPRTRGGVGAPGINRVSLGVQSFVQRELARTGRKHTAQIVEREIAVLRSAGLTNINIDLIAGLPGQTRASWRRIVILDRAPSASARLGLYARNRRRQPPRQRGAAQRKALRRARCPERRAHR